MRFLRGIALAAYGALLFATASPWPDDWDAIGFVDSVRDFDLAQFHPHPPGYPVYVAFVRIVAALEGDPLRACLLVAAASGIVTIAFVWDAARRCFGERTAWLVALFVGVAPGVWRACSGVGTEAPALAWAAVCVWGLTVSRTGSSRSWGATALGVGAGMGLGVRLSWAPLYLAALAMAPRQNRKRAWGVGASALAAWAVPFIGWVGPGKLVALYTAHFAGHAEHWGGTVLTEPGIVRVLWVARDVFVDGLGVGTDPLGIAIAAILLVATGHGLLGWRAAGWRNAGRALALTAPYLVWIALGQNVRDQPRHAVPLVAAIAAGLALSAVRSRIAPGLGLSVARSPIAPSLVGAMAIATALRTAVDAHARRTIAPPGQQLVDLARAQTTPKRLAIFGVASVRFFEGTELTASGIVARSLGEAHMELTRLDALPARVWVTNELAGTEDSRWPLRPIATLCRPARLDRGRPCLDVLEWSLPGLPIR